MPREQRASRSTVRRKPPVSGGNRTAGKAGRTNRIYEEQHYKANGSQQRKKTSTTAGRNRKKKRRLKKLSFKNVLVVVLICLLVWVCRFRIISAYCEFKLSMPYERGEAVIKKGVLIGGKDYSGKNMHQALAAVGDNESFEIKPEDIAVEIKSTDGKYTYSYKMSDFDVSFDPEGAVNKAVNFAQDETSSSWLREFKALESGTVNFPVINYSRTKIANAVNTIASQINVKEQNASVKRVNGAFVISESKTGYSINSADILSKIIDNFDNKKFGETIQFEIKVTEPKIKTSDFQGADKLIGTFSSTYKKGDENRIQNLRNACEKINGVVVYPNEIFSTNAHFAPFTEANGWANAGTIVNGEIEDSLGGGMCQVSSVLYDALLKAELDVTERFNHSIKVGYAPYAFDATLAGDYKDLKFKNDTKKPVYIEAYLDSNSVNVNIYGEEIHESGRTVELENKFIESKEPEEPITKNDPDMYEGETRVISPLNSYTYELYKKVYINGVLKETVKMNTSTYKSRRQITYKGTKKKEEATTTAQ